MPCASEAGHYVDLTEFFNANNLAEVMAPATVKYYAEYPGNSGTYWAVPAEGDAVGWSYRKDWFEDPTEMTNFAANYGYSLAVPTTWAQLLDIAEFFNRPDEGRYGVAIYTDNSDDAMVMGVENAIFSYGGELGDVETFQVEGILNSPQAVQALKDYKRLFSYTPPGWSKAFFVENNQAITEGLAAMSMGDKIGVLNKGRLVQVGTPSQVYDQPCNTFVARAVGSPPMNLIDGRVSSGSRALGEGVLPVAAPEGRDLTFGIRPENLRLESGAPVAGRVFDIEDHGVIKILTLQVADNRIQATVPARTKVALDEVVRFGWLPGKVLVFDRVTGDNLALV